MSQSRERPGPLELDMPERRVVIADDGTVVGIRTKARFDAHKLIEELMIQANVCAAEELEKIKSPLLYQIHDAPSDAKIAALSDAGIEIAESPADMGAALKRAMQSA